MSSVGQAIGGIVGGVIGFFTPLGPVYGAQIGMMVGGVLDPPRTEGPRLEDLTAQTSVYGAFIPRLYGTTAVTGNVLWIQGDKLIEHSVESDGKGGPVVTNYEYFATFAVGLCEGEIDAVRRIWVGGQLWYDAGSDDLATIIASNQNGTFTLYTGSDTQLADPLIQADRGVANVPAYRGLAYIVFDRLPLEKYGNSLAGTQVKVEVVMSGSDLGPRLLSDTVVAGYPVNYYPRPAQWAGDGVICFYAYDPFAGLTVVDGETIANDEKLLTISYAAELVNIGQTTEDSFRPRYSSSGFTTVRIGILDGSDVWWPEYAATSAYPIQNGVNEILPWGVAGNRDTAFVSADRGDIADYLIGEAGRYIVGVATDPAGSRLLIITGPLPRVVTAGVADRYFILSKDATVVMSGAISGGIAELWNLGIGASGEAVGGGTVFDFERLAGWTSRRMYGTGTDAFYYYIDASGTMSVSGQVGPLTVPGGASLSSALSDGLFYVLVRSPTQAILRIFTAHPHVSGNTVALSTIVESECLQSDLLTAGDLDVTELTDQVRGYRISSLSPLRGGIDQLRKAWPFDAIQHGYKILFKKRGGASVATITEGELDARAAGANPGVRISNVREMDLIMPQQLTVQYMDATREYDVNVAEESR